MGIFRVCIGVPLFREATISKKGPIKTSVLLKGAYMGFHVSLGECIAILLVSPLITPIGVPYVIPFVTPFKEFRL